MKLRMLLRLCQVNQLKFLWEIYAWYWLLMRRYEAWVRGLSRLTK